MLGDNISGTVTIDPSIKKDKIKHKGVLIRLIARFFREGIVTDEALIEQTQIIEPGVITSVVQQKFTLKVPKLNFPSYRGIRMHFQYYLIAIVSRIFSDITYEKRIIFVEPVPAPVKNPGSILRIDAKYVNFEIAINQTAFAMDEKIVGEMRIINNKNTQIQNVYLNLVVHERVNLSSNDSKLSSTPLSRYQLIDGFPRSGVNIPFVIQLKPLRLWSMRQGSGAIIDTTFSLEVVISTTEKHVVAGNQPIQIYMRKLD